MSSSHPSKRKRDHESLVAKPPPALLPSALLAMQTPVVNMRVEILDTEHLWSPGYLVKVQHKNDKSIVVTVAFDGWGRQWDETLTWGNERLAPLYTYTKRAKCMVDMIRTPKNRKPLRKELEHLPPNAIPNYASVWPCVVSFRMPHPASPNQGELGLRQEQKVFCQPYHPELLPPSIRLSLQEDSGLWWNVGRLRLWRDQPQLFGILPEGFQKAFEKAQQDSVGVLSNHAFEKGTSLLIHRLRVLDMEGAKVRDGQLVSATASTTAAKMPLETSALPEPPPPAEVRICPMRPTSSPKYHAPPKLPQSISLQVPLYPGVTRCGNRNEWTASLAVNGNSIFLGTFSTQTQAYQSMLKATGDSTTVVETNLENAKRMDLLAIPMEDVIAAFEDQYNPSTHSFSLHKWTLEKVSHYCYLRDKELHEGTNVLPEREDPPSPRLSKRKQSRPTRKH